ncbi:MAG: LPP20 family lipoprotein [Calditrichae bacterium]|nr:LPP20 family lipoprotein [Calditrichota bacterium]MCB9058817.1 LPP20 family lipoprotein [Calditrichia bacterium]
MRLSRIIFLTAFILSAININAQIYQQVPNAGAINWQDQILNSTGIGAPDPKVPFAAQRAGAIRAAKLDALRQLLETVKGMNLTSETTVRNAMIENDVIQTRVEGVVKNFKMTDTRYLSDGSVEVDVEIPLSGILLNELLPQQVGGKVPGSINYNVSPQPNFSNTIFTGLIIDARGLGLRPAMAPKVLDENGNEVYGTGYVSRDYAVQIGVVGYEKDMSRAAKDDRVKDNPVVVKALRVEGTNQTDVVISNNDAANISAAGKNLNFMEQCKVMFILD